MADSTEVTWKDGMAFDVALEGHELKIDAAEAFGGRGYGPKPKSLLLSALAGCTGMDVVSMLKKMRMSWKTFGLKVDGELSADHPKVYKKIHITYRFTGDALDSDKIKRAIELSQKTYCGVTVMLSSTAEITYDLETAPA